MDSQMIEKVTKLVLSKMQEQQTAATTETEEVKIWNHTTSKPDIRQIETVSSHKEVEGKAKFSSFPTDQRKPAKKKPVTSHIQTKQVKEKSLTQKKSQGT